MKHAHFHRKFSSKHSCPAPSSTINFIHFNLTQPMVSTVKFEMSILTINNILEEYNLYFVLLFHVSAKFQYGS